MKCASPEIWRSGRTVTPSASIGSTNIVRPRCLGTPASVRASSSPKEACWALVVHTFWPDTLQLRSSLRLARVWTPARSEPAAGSENSWHQTSSAASIGPRWRCFWSSVPWAISVGPSMPTPITSNSPGAPARLISWLSTTWCTGPRPCPPYSAGHVTAASPASASLPCHWRWAVTNASSSRPRRCGASEACSSSQARTLVRYSASSGVSLRSMRPTLPPAAARGGSRRNKRSAAGRPRGRRPADRR